MRRTTRARRVEAEVTLVSEQADYVELRLDVVAVDKLNGLVTIGFGNSQHTVAPGEFLLIRLPQVMDT